MFSAFQVLTVILVAVAMALSLAHALELPGKMRLDKETYYAMQRIYYPGFTIGGGIGEAGGTISTIILLILTPLGSTDFWLTLVALLGLIGMQAVYWLFTHPVNESRPPDWTELRDRWEYSHVARAGFALLGLIALIIAISCSK